MKFEYDPNASFLVNAALGTMDEGSRMMIYSAQAGEWQFMLNYDEMHDQWTSTYRTANRYLKEGVKYTTLQCEPPLAISNKKHRYYKTREEAEAAAQRKLNELNN